MKIRLISVIAFFAACTSTTAQQIAVPLKTIFDSSFYNFSYYQPEETDTSARVQHDLLQYYTLTRNIIFPALNYTIPVLIGVSKGGVKLIIFDRNNNRDFTDDSVIYFPESFSEPRRLRYRSTTFLLPQVGNIEFDYNIVQPAGVLVDLKDSLENKIFFDIRPNQYREANILLNNQQLKLFFFSEKLYTFDRRFTRIVIDSSTGKPDLKKLYASEKYYKPGDKFRIGHKAYQFKQMTRDSVLIEEFASTEIIGNKVGFIAPPFSAISLDGDLIDSKSFLGHYLLLDFWGTWCGPCKQIEPLLKQIHLKAANLKMLGMAFDKDANLVSDHIRSESISWPQILLRGDKAAPINDVYDVTAYPNLILIDPGGRIILNELGVDGVDHLIKMLKEKNLF